MPTSRTKSKSTDKRDNNLSACSVNLDIYLTQIKRLSRNLEIECEVAAMFCTMERNPFSYEPYFSGKQLEQSGKKT